MAGLTFSIFGHDVSMSKTLHHVEGESSKSAGRIGSTFKHLGSVIGSAFAAVQVFQFFKDSIAQATEAQKVGAQTTAVLKSTGGAANVTAAHIDKLSTAISNKVGIDDEAIQSNENMLLTFTNVRNEVGKGNDIFDQATQTVTDMSVALGQAGKESAIQLGKALNDPIKGISALQRVGVTFTDGQKKQIDAMVKTGDTMSAQKVILAELNKEFGGSAEAQVTPAMKASVAWGNLQETIGTYLMPVITALMNFIVQKVVPIIRQAAAWVEKHRQGFIDLGKTLIAIGEYLYNNLVKPIMAAVIPAVKAVIGWIKDHKEGLEKLGKVLVGVLKVAIGLIVVAFKVLIAIIKVVVGIIRVLADIIMWLWHHVVEPAARGIATAWHGISNAAHDVWDVVSNIFGKFRTGFNGLKSFIRGAVRIISDIWKGIGTGLQWAWDHIIGPVVHVIESAAQALIDAYNNVKLALGQDVVVSGHGHVATSGVVKPGFAQGTGFFAGGSTLVGEHGREMVDLPRGSRISSNSTTESQLRGGGGMTALHVHIDAPPYATQTDIARAIKQAVEYGAAAGVKFHIGRAVV